jgi:hypothetical protein
LETFVTTTLHYQLLEAELRKTKPGTGERYTKLTRLHRQSVALVVTLATRLRLARTPTDGDLPGRLIRIGPGEQRDADHIPCER